MMQPSHAVVWLDHAEAHILHFTSEDVRNKFAGEPYRRLQHRRDKDGRPRAPADQAYYDTIAGSLVEAEEILVAGPATATAAFVRHLNEHAHDVRARVVAIENVDRPSDGQLLDYARRHFRAAEGPPSS
jgi:stalled ribosome rescue protein Dom34